MQYLKNAFLVAALRQALRKVESAGHGLLRTMRLATKMLREFMIARHVKETPYGYAYF